MSEKIIIIKDKVSYFEKKYVQLFEKYKRKQNKLLSAILYSYKILTNDDFNLLKDEAICGNKEKTNRLLGGVCEGFEWEGQK